MKPSSQLVLTQTYFSSIAGMDEAEAVAYIRAIWSYWYYGCEGLENGDDRLRRICGCERHNWARVKGVIFSSPYFRLIDGRWHEEEYRDRYVELERAY